MREGVEGDTSALAVRAARWRGEPRECVMGEWVGDPLRGSENTRERAFPDSMRSMCVCVCVCVIVLINYRVDS